MKSPPRGVPSAQQQIRRRFTRSRTRGLRCRADLHGVHGAQGRRRIRSSHRDHRAEFREGRVSASSPPSPGGAPGKAPICTTASLALYFERRCMTGAAWTAGASLPEDRTRECVGVSVLLTLAHAVRGSAGTRRIKGSSLILRGHAISQGEPRGAMERSKDSASQRIGPDLRTISPASSASHARGEPAPSPR